MLSLANEVCRVFTVRYVILLSLLPGMMTGVYSPQIHADQQQTSTALVKTITSPWPHTNFADNLRYSIDASSRPIYFSHRDELGFQHALGLDLHKVFSGERGDISTLLVQGYLTRIDNLPQRPSFFDDDDTEFVYRIFNINYTGFKGKLPNVKVGHFEIPFGLEHIINTNGTLRDYNNGRKLGLKADWGVTLNKELPTLEYEVSASSGGGQKFDSQDGSYVYAARLGTLRNQDQVYGVSLYKAEVGGVKRQYLGLDAQWYCGLQGFFAEISGGDNDSIEVVNTLLEWNIRNRSEAYLTYLQLLGFAQKIDGDWQDNVAAVVGLRYVPEAHWSFSGQLKRDVSVFDGAFRETTASLQIRYRW
ncbi:MAG: hypothetical protein V3T17_10365 [Pseudomonadales bacterium]